MNYRNALGSVMKDLRNEQGLNLRQVSGKACIALGYLSEVERGHKEPSSEIVELIASEPSREHAGYAIKARMMLAREEAARGVAS